jgi:hypothetical protein
MLRLPTHDRIVDRDPSRDLDRHALAFFSEALEHVTEQARCSPLDCGDEDGAVALA